MQVALYAHAFQNTKESLFADRAISLIMFLELLSQLFFATLIRLDNCD
jgi:hypothetical protein